MVMPAPKQQKSPENLNKMRDALRRILAMRNRSPVSVSREAGLSLSAVNDILNGRITNPSLETLQSIAAVLDVSVAQVIGEGDIMISADISVLRIPMIGYEHGGVFVMPTTKRPKELPSHISIRVDSDLAAGKHFALWVKGKTMDRAKPRPILPNDIAVCRDFLDACQPIIPGKIYAIRRRLPDGSEETSLRRIEKVRKGFELIAESTDKSVVPKIIAPDDLDGDPTKPLHVLGRLVRIEQQPA
jgi:transcriptional regulator with XRE-family HTH domain